MAAAPFHAVLRHLRTIAADERCKGQSDGQLLARFAESRDEVAFEALMRRHGPLVLGVCRRMLGRGPELDDAFQATFLVLARKAGSIRRRTSVASWLYGVALRMAKDHKLLLARRRRHEHTSSDLDEIAGTNAMGAEPADQASMRELGAILVEEMQRLTKKYREALILCHLEGQSGEEAAKLLGCPLATLKSRLARGRELLRQRLVRRGVTMSAASLAAVFAEQSVTAAVPTQTLYAALDGAIAFAAKPVASAVVSAKAAALANSFLKTLTLTIVSLSLLTVLTITVVGFATTLAPPQTPTLAPPPAPVAVLRPGAVQVQPLLVAKDLLGDPLPLGAIARLGTLRMRIPDGYVHALAGAPDGKLFASAGGTSHGRVSLWDAATGAEVRRLESPGSDASLLAFSSDGTLFAERRGFGVGKEAEINVWNVQSGKLVKRIDWTAAQKSSNSRVRAAMFVDGAKTLLVVTAGGVVQWWDVAIGKMLREWHAIDGIKPPTSAADGTFWDLMTVAVSADGKRVAAAAIPWNSPSGTPNYSNSTLCAWDTVDQKVLWHVERKNGCGSGVAMSPNGDVLANDLPGGGLELRDMATGKARGVIPIKEVLLGSAHPLPIAWTADGKKFAVGPTGAPTQIWDLESGKKVQEFWVGGVEGFLWRVWAIAFLGAGDRLVVAADDQLLCWDVATGKETLQWPGHRGPVRQLRFSSESKQLFSGCGDLADLNTHEAVMWDTFTWKETGRKYLLDMLWDQRHLKSAAAADLSIGLKVNDDGTVHVWDFATAKSLRTLEFKPWKPASRGAVVGVVYCCFSPTDKLVFVERHTKDLHAAEVFDVATGKKRCELPGAFYAFSPDDQHVVWHDNQGTIHVADVSTGKDIWQFAGPLDRPPDPSLDCFSKDSQYLATMDRNSGQVDIWSLQKGKHHRTLTGFGPLKTGWPPADACLAFSPDGRMLAVSGRDGTHDVELWELSSANLRARLAGHEGHVTSLAFSPDGRLLASGSRDTTALIWDLVNLKK